MAAGGTDVSAIGDLASNVRQLAAAAESLGANLSGPVPQIQQLAGSLAARARYSDAPRELRAAADALDAAARALVNAADQCAETKLHAQQYSAFLAAGGGSADSGSGAATGGIAAIAGRVADGLKAAIGTAAVVANTGVAVPVMNAAHIDPAVSGPVAGLIAGVAEMADAESSAREQRDETDGGQTAAEDVPGEHRPPPFRPVSDLYRIEGLDDDHGP